MATLGQLLREIEAGNYAMDGTSWGKDDVGNWYPIKVDANGVVSVDTSALETILNNIDSKDFATETTLDTRLSSLETKMDTLNSKIDAVNTNIDDSQDVDNNFNVSQKGSIVATDVDGNIVDTDVKEVRCLSTSTKPNVADFPLFTYLIEVDTDKIYYNDGTGWVLD